MKHWRPEFDAARPLDAGPQRRRKRDWTSVDFYAPPRARPQHHGEAQLGGAVGLALMIGFCLMAAASAIALLALPNPIDDMAIEP